MSRICKLAIENNDSLGSVNSFFRKLLEKKVVGALLVPQESVNHKSVIQTLARDEKEIVESDPFAPLLLMNSATLVSQLTVDNPKDRIGAVLRSCEIRATVELVKLKQINMDNLIIIGVDCMGTYESNTYQKAREGFENSRDLTRQYLSKSDRAEAAELEGGELRLACQGCEYPNPENTDIAINFLGCDVNKEIFVQLSDKLDDVKPEELGLLPAEDNNKWAQASKICLDKRTKFRDSFFREVLDSIKDVKSFLKELEHCRRCYNCRKECPICYCRECIFDSLTFEHNSEQYFDWAKKKGKIRMPSDTLLFHLTRMNHMIISCVGCGQCTSACPNNIPIAKFFKTIGFKVQELFEYKAGRNVEEENPQGTFKEDEFLDAGKSGSEC
ncbi:MAG: 4Fe-4S dicluster domain-containing protein [Candidatus Omnitrophota bacterium]